MGWVLLLFTMEVGMLPNSLLWNVPETLPGTPQIIIDRSAYVEFDARVVILHHLFIEGSMTNRMFESPYGNSWYPAMHPFRDEYSFGAGIMFGNFEAGWRHFCEHPVATNWQDSQQFTNLGYEKAYDEIYIRFKAAVEIF